jgi:UDP-2,4-diacetamido-2,4,6-trideoxy-beta-L-altropyranose hydrolase
MRFLFRVDAGPQLGLGHLVRCTTLAGRLRQAAHDVTFAGRYAGDAAAQLLRAGGAHVVELPLSPLVPATPASPEWRHPEPTREADATLDAIRGAGPFDWLVVDSYALDATWERAMREAAPRVMVVDDLANRPHDCDILLDQNFFRHAEGRYDGLVPDTCRTLLGPRYALLRPAFAAARAALAARSGELRRVLVSCGGHDGVGATRKALNAIEQAALGTLEVDVVTSRDNPDFDTIDEQCRAHDGWRLHESADMAALMAQADIAIGAGGTMNWERAALRLPCVLISIAENQEPIARDLAAEGVCVYLGRAAQVSTAQLADALRGLAAAPSLVRALGERAGTLVDGRGAERVARHLVPEAVDLRPATVSDAVRIYEWRNAPETRRHALDPAPLEFDGHVRWLGSVLDAPGVALLVGTLDGADVGVLRYDLDGDAATVSVYLVPGTSGAGLGTALIDAGTRWLRRRHPQVRRIVAAIRPDNTASLGAFAAAGFVAHTHTYTREL